MVSVGITLILILYKILLNFFLNFTFLNIIKLKKRTSFYRECIFISSFYSFENPPKIARLIFYIFRFRRRVADTAENFILTWPLRDDNLLRPQRQAEQFPSL